MASWQFVEEPSYEIGNGLKIGAEFEHEGRDASGETGHRLQGVTARAGELKDRTRRKRGHRSATRSLHHLRRSALRDSWQQDRADGEPQRYALRVETMDERDELVVWV